MKTVAALAASLFLASAQEVSWRDELTIQQFQAMNAPQVFEQWMVDFGKTYATEEAKLKAFQVWLENTEQIAEHNSFSGRSFKMRLNQFGDVTGDDFKIAVHGHTGSCLLGVKDNYKRYDPAAAVVNLPTTVDWEAQGVVTPVKNQGQCGSCWAFSATGSTECQVAIKTGKLNSLSEQQLVDCSGAYGNEGCNGGYVEEAFRYIEANGGLCTEQEYPYKGVGGSCKASSCGTKFDPISDFTPVTKDSESSLEAAVVTGCVSVCIEADQFAFQFYSSGVLDGQCGTNIDHCVLAVGYGTLNGQEYWKVKNSWGTSWGEQGYVLICRACNKNGSKGECGIYTGPSFPDSK